MKRNKKVLIVTNHSYMLWQFRKELIEELLKEYQVVVSTPYEGHENDFEKMGCTMINTKMERRGINPFKDIKLCKFYWNLLKNEKPDIVITYSIKPNVYAGTICRMRKIPYFVNVQGLGTAFQKKGLALLAEILYKTGLKGAKKVFFENEGNANFFLDKKIITQEQLVLLPGAGVNLEHYAYAEYPDNKELHFLYLGRIMKEKGIDELFYAIRELRKKYGNKVVLDLVGFFEDEYKNEVEELIKDGTVIFHGFQAETRPYYAKADCVVLPSYHEGMSNVLLEASAMGRAIITSDIPGCREAVSDGENGYLCCVKDKEDLYRKMEQFCELDQDARKEIGCRGRALMVEKFDKGKVVQIVLDELLK